MSFLLSLEWFKTYIFFVTGSLLRLSPFMTDDTDGKSSFVALLLHLKFTAREKMTQFPAQIM